MSYLFSPLKLRELTFANRVFVSPMCQYSAKDGVPNDWHLVHLGSRAVGGAGLVIAEATAVSPEGRISPGDTGLWSDEQMHAFARIVNFIHAENSLAGIQLAHAGRKASTDVPWNGGRPLSPGQGAWQTIAPSATPFDAGFPSPREMGTRDIRALVDSFIAAAQRSRTAGFDLVELHMAHGYLLHEFLSPLSNQRTDAYGGSLEGRMKLPLEIARVVRDLWPRELPLFVRISASDWAEGGWDLSQSIEFVRQLQRVGVDFIDCSSGGLVPHAKVQVGPGYQVPFAAAIRKETGIATGAVGLITDADQAEQILASGQADAVLLARSFLYDPYWPLHAAETLNAETRWPMQYVRARRSRS